MALEKLFCVGKSNKLKKSSPQQTKPKTTSNESKKSSQEYNSQHAPSLPYRYVTTEFRAEAADEISVSPGDLALYQYADNSGVWVHILCFRTHQSGYVPMKILANEPPRSIQCKKLPRSLADPSIGGHQSLSNRVNQFAGEHSSNGDNHRHHVNDHGPRFGIPHSFHGSTGQHSLPKYPDLIHLGTPNYYNLRTSNNRYEKCEMEFRPFIRDNYGIYVALHKFIAREERDLSISPGDYVTVLNRDDEDWYWIQRHCDMKEGFVPAKFICDNEQVKSYLYKENSTLTVKSSNPNDFHTYINHQPEQDSSQVDQQSISQNM